MEQNIIQWYGLCGRDAQNVGCSEVGKAVLDKYDVVICLWSRKSFSGMDFVIMCNRAPPSTYYRNNSTSGGVGSGHLHMPYGAKNHSMVWIV